MLLLQSILIFFCGLSFLCSDILLSLRIQLKQLVQGPFRFSDTSTNEFIPLGKFKEANDFLELKLLRKEQVETGISQPYPQWFLWPVFRKLLSAVPLISFHLAMACNQLFALIQPREHSIGLLTFHSLCSDSCVVQLSGLAHCGFWTQSLRSTTWASYGLKVALEPFASTSSGPWVKRSPRHGAWVDRMSLVRSGLSMVIPSSTETLPDTMLLTLQTHWARQEPSCFLPSTCYKRKMVTGRSCNKRVGAAYQSSGIFVWTCGINIVTPEQLIMDLGNMFLAYFHDKRREKNLEKLLMARNKELSVSWLREGGLCLRFKKNL